MGLINGHLACIFHFASQSDFVDFLTPCQERRSKLSMIGWCDRDIFFTIPLKDSPIVNFCLNQNNWFLNKSVVYSGLFGHFFGFLGVGIISH